MTAEQLIAEVRQLAQLADVDSADLSNPAAEADSDEGILAIANREMRGKLLSDVMALREEFFVLKQEYAITTPSAAYRIPSRAVGAKLRDVVYVDTGNNALGMPRLRPEDVAEQYRFGFILQSNSIVLRSQENAGILRVSYFARPGKLVKATAVGPVTAIDTATNVITVSGEATGCHTATLFDFQKAGSPFEYLAVEVAGVHNGGHGGSHTFTFAGGLPAGLAVGDVLCAAEQSNFVQLPEEAANVLTYRTAAKVLEAVGDDNGLKRLADSAKEMEEAMRVLLTPRVDGRPQKLSSKKLFGAGWWRL